MVAHHRIGGHVDGEYRGQLTDTGLDPATAVLKALAADGVVPAQKGTAHTAVDHVVPRCVGQRDEGRAGTGHGRSLER